MKKVKGKIVCQFPSKPATRKQTWAVFCMTGEDIRNANLTRAEVSNMISDLKSKGDHFLAEGKTYFSKHEEDTNFICTKAALKETSAKIMGRENHPMTVGAVLESKKKKAVKTRKTVSTVWAKVLLRKAAEAGQKAMDELIASNSVPAMVVQEHSNMLDDSSPVEKEWVVPGGPCGFASIRVKCVNGPSRKFINQLKKEGIAGDRNSFKEWSKSDYYGGYMKSFTLIGGQSLAYKTAYANAFAEVLKAEGIDTWVWTRMD